MPESLSGFLPHRALSASAILGALTVSLIGWLTYLVGLGWTGVIMWANISVFESSVDTTYKSAFMRTFVCEFFKQLSFRRRRLRERIGASRRRRSASDIVCRGREGCCGYLLRTKSGRGSDLPIGSGLRVGWPAFQRKPECHEAKIERLLCILGLPMYAVSADWSING